MAAALRGWWADARGSWGAYTGMPITPARGRWAAHLCSCFASPYCMMPLCSACAPCVPLARAAGRAGVARFDRVLLASGLLTAALIVTPGAWWPLVYAELVALLVLVVVVRRRLAQKYSIEEHALASAALGACCCCCAIAQQAMHVDLVEYGVVQLDCSFSEKHPLADRANNDNVEML